MGSLATETRICQKSKKRVFPESSSESNSQVSDNWSQKRKNKMIKLNEDAMVTISSGTSGAVQHHLIDRVCSSKEVKSHKKGKGVVIEINSEDSASVSYNGKDYIDLSSDDNVSEASMASSKQKGTKTSTPSQKLQKCVMKGQSLKKLVKGQHHKTSSGSGHNSVEDEAVRKYRNFKKFDIVEDHSDHHYSSSKAAAMLQNNPPRNWAKKIQDEWRILKKNLPDMIFVRVYESRMDLLRAVIIGAEGTPYHNGLFFFDLCFPSNYPQSPPQVYYHSGGLRINPNLYNSGKVCLSLLNTWYGVKKEQWLPNTSTMLQVLVSIQGLILNANPYFNEPGYEDLSNSVGGQTKALRYNERILVLSLKTMVYTMKKPPKHFEDLVIGHFRAHGSDILTTCKAYSKGMGVNGCEDMGSVGFKYDVEGYMRTLVGAFKNIKVKNVDEFMPPPRNLTQKIRAFFRI